MQTKLGKQNLLVFQKCSIKLQWKIHYVADFKSKNQISDDKIYFWLIGKNMYSFSLLSSQAILVCRINNLKYELKWISKTQTMKVIVGRLPEAKLSLNLSKLVILQALSARTLCGGFRLKLQKKN